MEPKYTNSCHLSIASPDLAANMVDACGRLSKLWSLLGVPGNQTMAPNIPTM